MAKDTGMPKAPKEDKSNPKSWGDYHQAPKESGWKKFEHIAFPLSNLHSGGTVKKTGNYRLRKGEKVLTVTQQKAVGIKAGKKKTTRKRVAGK